MKKMLILFLVVFLAFSMLAGCGEAEEVITDPVTVVIPEVSQETEQEVQVEKVFYGKVNTQNTGVNIRATPSTDGIVVGTADIGEVVRVLEQGEWCKVEFPEGQGYIFGELLDIFEGDPEEVGNGGVAEGNDVITRVVE